MMSHSATKLTVVDRSRYLRRSMKRSGSDQAPLASKPRARSWSQVPVHFEEGFFADPDYSEFDCIDDEPPEVDRNPPGRVESKDSRPPRDLLELVDYFPGKKLCWASEFLEDEENKTS